MFAQFSSFEEGGVTKDERSRLSRRRKICELTVSVMSKASSHFPRFSRRAI